jgi:acyl-[acyl-carrier-protein]-phospholipid O-acyltransferase/long-chain-fatty-acid--[acyl-carrier-protein] ligase
VGDWETTFHSPYLQGYGLTETSPVVSVNLPDLPGCIRRKLGSVGRLFHGMAARIVCPESFKPLPIGQVGLLELKGANIFREYLNDRVSSERSFEGQWFKTHDLARLDADGFLYIEGRLSRFSKIGGEMVSHHRIEDLLHRFFPSASGVIHFVVMGVEDVQKGERLVVLTSQSIDLESIRGVLNPHLPNMWIPRECICVPAIPLLASGKLDLKACAALIQ